MGVFPVTATVTFKLNHCNCNYKYNVSEMSEQVHEWSEQAKQAKESGASERCELGNIASDQLAHLKRMLQ